MILNRERDVVSRRLEILSIIKTDAETEVSDRIPNESSEEDLPRNSGQEHDTKLLPKVYIDYVFLIHPTVSNIHQMTLPRVLAKDKLTSLTPCLELLTCRESSREDFHHVTSIRCSSPNMCRDMIRRGSIKLRSL